MFYYFEQILTTTTKRLSTFRTKRTLPKGAYNSTTRFTGNRLFSGRNAKQKREDGEREGAVAERRYEEIPVQEDFADLQRDSLLLSMVSFDGVPSFLLLLETSLKREDPQHKRLRAMTKAFLQLNKTLVRNNGPTD